MVVFLSTYESSRTSGMFRNKYSEFSSPQPNDCCVHHIVTIRISFHFSLTDFWEKWWKHHPYKELWNSLSQRLGFSPRKMLFLLNLRVILERQQRLLCNTRIHTGDCQHSRETEVSSGQSWCWDLLYWFDTSAWTEKVALGQQLCVQWQCYQSGSELRLCHHWSDKDIWCRIMWRQESLDLREDCQMIIDLYKSESFQSQQKRLVMTKARLGNMEHQKLPIFHRWSSLMNPQSQYVTPFTNIFIW